MMFKNYFQMVGSLLTALAVCALRASSSCLNLDTNNSGYCRQNSINSSWTDLSRTICDRPVSEVGSQPPPYFLSEPLDHVIDYSEGIPMVHFHCNVTSPLPEYTPTISWEHNGNVVPNEDLATLMTTEEGVYRCIVNREQDKFRLSSQFGRLSLSSCHGWIDELLDPSFSMENSIELNVSKGGAAVLECRPNTTASLGSSSVHWLRNNNATGLLDDNHIQLPGGSLLIRNFDLPPGEQTVTYSCVVLTLACPQADRRFTITVSGDPQSPITSRNQASSIVIGSNVTLYCVGLSKPVSSRNIWYKDGTQLTTGHKAFDWSTFGPMDDVLVLKNITMETGGVYRCVNAEGASLTSSLTVLSPPTSVSITSIGVQNRTLVLTAATQTLSLNCAADSLSHDHGMTFDWFFRGSLLVGLAENRDGLRLVRGGALLNVSGVGDRTGSYQCVARNLAGSVSAILFVFGKANTPSISLRPNGVLQYTFTISPSNMISAHIASYDVEIYYHRVGNSIYYECSCTLDKNIGYDGRGIVNVSIPPKYSSYQMYFRTSTVYSDGSRSDYAPYYESDRSCGENIVIAPPAKPQLSQYPRNNGDQWEVTLMWDNVQYPSSLYNSVLSVSCDRQTPLQKHFQSNIHSYNLSVPCCTNCTWSVTYNTLNGYRVSSSKTFVTEPFQPSQPATLNSVSRESSDDWTISLNFTLPPNNISCNASKFVVHYADLETLPMDLADKCGQPFPDSSRYWCTLTLNFDKCRQRMNVSVRYGNERGWSDVSPPVLLEGVRKDDLSDFKVSVTSSTSDSITMSIAVSNVIDCLLRNHPPKASIKVCIHLRDDPCEGGWKDIVDYSYPHVFSGLASNTTYDLDTIVLADQVIGNSTKTLLGSTSGKETSMSTSSPPVSDAIALIWKTVPPSVILLVAILVCVILVCCCRKTMRYCRKRRESDAEQLNDRRLLLHDSNNQLRDDDLVSMGGPDGAAPSFHSDHTHLNNFKDERMENYLKDVEQEWQYRQQDREDGCERSPEDETTKPDRGPVHPDRDLVHPDRGLVQLAADGHPPLNSSDLFIEKLKSDSQHSRSKSKSRQYSAHHKKASSKNQHKKTISQQLGTDSRQHGTDSRQLGTDSKQLETDSRQLGTDSRQLGTDSRQLETDSRQLGTDSRQLETDSRQLGTDSRLLGTDSRQLGTDSRRLGTDSRQLETDSRQLGTDSRQLETEQACPTGYVHDNHIVPLLENISRPLLPLLDTTSQPLLPSLRMDSQPILSSSLATSPSLPVLPSSSRPPTIGCPLSPIVGEAVSFKGGASINGYVASSSTHPFPQIPTTSPLTSSNSNYDARETLTHNVIASPGSSTTPHGFIIEHKPSTLKSASGYVELPCHTGMLPPLSRELLDSGFVASKGDPGTYVASTGDVHMVHSPKLNSNSGCNGYVSLPSSWNPTVTKTYSASTGPGCLDTTAANGSNKSLVSCDSDDGLERSDMETIETASLDSSVFCSDDLAAPMISPFVLSGTTEMPSVRNQSPRKKTPHSEQFPEVFELVSKGCSHVVSCSSSKDSSYVSHNGGQNPTFHSTSSSEGYFSGSATPSVQGPKQFDLETAGSHCCNGNVLSADTNQLYTDTDGIELQPFTWQSIDTKPSDYVSIDTKPSGSIGVRPTGSIDTKSSGYVSGSIDTKSSGYVSGSIDTKSSGYVSGSIDTKSSGYVSNLSLPHSESDGLTRNSTNISSKVNNGHLVTSKETIPKVIHPRTSSSTSYSTIPSLLQKSVPAAATVVSQHNYHNISNIDLSAVKLDFPAESHQFY